nr:NAD(P)-binding domain-containing protein [Clostridia bacterium]
MILSVIGTGNMGKALISGLLHKGALPAESLLLYDIDQDKAKELAASVGAYACSNLKEAFGRADTI